MKTLFALLFSIPMLAFGAGAPYIINLNGPGTNNTFYAPTVTADANGTNMVRTMTVAMRTNQDFVIQDQYLNNLFGIQRSKYSPGTNSEYYFTTGSPGSQIVDWQMVMASGGADIIWNISGNLNNAERINTSGGIIAHQVANPTYHAAGIDFPTVFDNFDRIFPIRINSLGTGLGVAPTVGGAAGAGASISGGTDTDGTDVTCHVTLTTGGSGLGAGVLFIYTFDTTPGAFVSVPRVTFSPGNAAAAQAAAVVYKDSTTTNFTLNSVAALDVSTDYIWDCHIIQ